MKWLILILSLCACAPREESLPPQVEEPRSDIAAAPPSGAAYVWQARALDPLTAEGLSIGRSNSGRGGLEDRLRAPESSGRGVASKYEPSSLHCT